MSPHAKALIATTLLSVLMAWVGPACMVGPVPDPGTPGGGQPPGGGSVDGKRDGGSADGGAPPSSSCSAICGEAVKASGCSAPDGGPDCSALCLESLSGGWASGSFGIDSVGRISSTCELNPPAAPCSGRTGDALTQCLAPYLERCAELCRCQSSCSALYEVQHACSVTATDCGTYQGCVGGRCTQPQRTVTDAGTPDGGALNCQAGTITFVLDGRVRSACATSVFQGAFVISTATGADDTGTFDAKLTLELQAGVHPVPPLDAARHALIELNADGRSYGSANGRGVVLVNSTANRNLLGAFKAQVIDKADATKSREVSGSFDVRF